MSAAPRRRRMHRPRRAAHGRRPAQELRRRARGARHLARHSRGRDLRRHRAERRRQVDAAQSAERHLPARCRRDRRSTASTSRACAPTGACATGSPARSRRSGCSGISPRSKTSSPAFICATTFRPGNIVRARRRVPARPRPLPRRGHAPPRLHGARGARARDRGLAVLRRAAHARNRPRARDRAAPADGRRAGRRASTRRKSTCCSSACRRCATAASRS